MTINKLVHIKGLIVLMATLSFTQLQAQEARIELSESMVAATNEFLASLTESQREAAQYNFDDDERLNWHFIPRPRQGVTLKAMDESQRQAANELLTTFLSAQGYSRTEAVRGLEEVLAEIEQSGRFVRDPELYYLTVFGQPSLDGDWALRYEGHHLALNWTFVGGAGIASTPQFFGSNPAEVRSGAKQGTRVLGEEEDLARKLVTSLDQAQVSEAILDAEVPGDIITGAQKEVQALAEDGILYSSLNQAQQSDLMNLVRLVASSQTDYIVQNRLDQIRQQGLEAIRFLWIGSTEKAAPHYYRVQGPGFLIEYDNTQNDANHVHLVWRDFDGDFGRDLLREHYNATANSDGHGHQH